MKSGETEVPTIERYLKCNLKPGSRVGVDPKHVSISQWQKFESTLKEADIVLFPLPNVIDECIGSTTRYVRRDYHL